MGEIETLLQAYDQFVRLPWAGALSGPEKVWFAIYDPPQERRLRLRLPEFEVATRNAGHGWTHLDLTDAFAQWMADHDYREAYFDRPEDMEPALTDFGSHVIRLLQQTLTAPAVDAGTVVAVTGVASLLGLTRASAAIEASAPAIRGRLLVFFPGRHERGNYRLLDAHDGWSYLAVPITGKQGG